MHTPDYEKVHTRYHSYDWALLTTAGWITWAVEENPSDGTQIAIMIRYRICRAPHN